MINWGVWGGGGFYFWPGLATYLGQSKSILGLTELMTCGLVKKDFFFVTGSFTNRYFHIFASFNSFSITRIYMYRRPLGTFLGLNQSNTVHLWINSFHSFIFLAFDKNYHRRYHHPGNPYNLIWYLNKKEIHFRAQLEKLYDSISSPLIHEL